MDFASLEQRLTELETRVEFQEHALAALSDALAASRLEATGNRQLLQRALDDLKQSRGEFFADPGSEPPPPHY
ncbi:MAG: hypothetical protein JWL98_419 [Xanthomonadaceae bacterium]|nr:hypothetical protein [Xanthomonadaceae bacterium]